MKTTVYTSRVSDSIADEAALLAEIVETARRKNKGMEISGAMVLMNHRFLQVLEGPVERVDSLVKKISADDRHTDFHILFDLPIEKRCFEEWSMMAAEVEDTDLFSAETLESLKNLYDHNFTFRADLFLELLQETLRDSELLRSMI